MSCSIIPLSYYVAEKAFDSSAEEFFSKYPEACEVEFHKLGYNGVYDVEFKMDYAKRRSEFIKILNKNIEKYCVVDEIFEYELAQDSNHSPWQDYVVRGMLDIQEKELYWNLPRFLKSSGFPYCPRKGVRVKKEDVYLHYSAVSEKIFNLGNQRIKYNSNDKEMQGFFDAAQKKDLQRIKQYVYEGVDINSINSKGMTALSYFLDYSFSDEDNTDIAALCELVAIGANPAIHGAGYDEDPLSEMCLYQREKAVSFMLEKGINPHIYPCIDEPDDWGTAETLLERTERWADGDPNTDGEPDEGSRAMLELLKKYAQYRY